MSNNLTQKTCQLSGIDEQRFVDNLAKYFTEKQYKVLREFPLSHGIVDLVLVSPRNNLILYECKISAKLGDIAQALGQLLIYRAQFKREKFQRIMCEIVVYDCMDTGTFNFLKKVCRTYNVILTVCKHCETQAEA